MTQGAGALFLAFGLASGPAGAAVQISSDATNNVTCTAGVCTPSGSNPVLNVSDLTALLASSDVKIMTDSSNSDIVIAASFTWASKHALSLDAMRGINFAMPVTLAAKAGLSIKTNDGGSGGDLQFATGASVNLWDLKSRLTIDGKKYALLNNLHDLAAAVTKKPTLKYAFAADYDATQDGTYSASVVPGELDGVFEGLGHTIANLTVVSSPSITTCLGGLFERADQGATVRDIHLANAQITALTQTTAGALVGCNSTAKGATVIGASSSGFVTVQKQSLAGGLVGAIAGNIINSSSSATVTLNGDNPDPAYGNLGGLAGYVDGTIIGSSASGDVTGGDNSCAGGLAGQASLIVQSHASGKVKVGSNTNPVGLPFAVEGAGGLACIAVARQSYATGSATANKDSYVGGLVAHCDYFSDDYAAVSDSYATGAVKGGTDSRVGGLIGYGSDAHYSYSTGAVSGGTSADVGGFIGRDEFPGSVFQSYWDMDTSGVSDPAGGAGLPTQDAGLIGLTSAQLQAKLPKGFSKKIWARKSGINGGFPYLIATPPN